MNANFQFEIGTPVAVSASKKAKDGAGSIIGLFVSTVSSSSRLALCDAVASVASAGVGRFVAPFTPVVGFTPIRAFFQSGLYVSCSGSAQTLTVLLGPSA